MPSQIAVGMVAQWKGKRDTATGRLMWESIPKSYARKQVYTDE